MLKVHEIFDSIQGEGSYQGRQMTFIRLFGCNRACKFCDQSQGEFVEMEEEQIVAKVTRENVCITGGEPLTQDIYNLSNLLYDTGKRVHLETNGDFDTLRKWGYDANGMRKYFRCGVHHVACSPKVKHPDQLKLDPCWIDDLKLLVNIDSVLLDFLPWSEFGEKYQINLFLQPENDKLQINWANFKYTLRLLEKLPDFDLSPQLHKLVNFK